MTPGQAAYEAYWHTRSIGPLAVPWTDSGGRDAWDAAAQAAITAHTIAITAAVVPDGDPWLERAAEILTEGQP